MNERKEYTVDVAGIPHTMKLDKAHAERIGATRIVTKEAVAPANKARSAADSKS